MLEVTTIGNHSHVGSQVLDEVRRRLVDVFLCMVGLISRWSARRLSTQQSSLALDGVYDTFPTMLNVKC